jgi:hypothetical protein
LCPLTLVFRYTELYLKYKKYLELKESKQAEAIKTLLRDDFERKFSYDQLVLLREIATKKYKFEEL